MPNNGTATVNAASEWNADVAQVVPLTQQQGGAFKGEGGIEYAQVLRVEPSVGVIPGKAFISIRNVSASKEDDAGAVILNPSSATAFTKLKHWSRIKIMCRGSCVFIGNLMKRRETIQGQSLLLEYWDDRWLLNKLYLRGALVWDRAASSLKWLTKYDPRVNPDGMANCTEVTIGDAGFKGTCYAFTELAEQATDAHTYHSDQDKNRGVGVAIRWTAEKWMSYLRLFALVAKNVEATVPIYEQDGILDQNKMLWPPFTFSGNTEDLTMKRALPDINFRGQSILRALETTMQVSGEYSYTVDYQTGNGKSILVANAMTTNSADKLELTLQTSGAAGDPKVIHDGVYETDASELATASVIDGQTPAIEASFIYTQANNVSTVNQNHATDTIYPAWTSDEEYKFAKIIVEALDVNGKRIMLTDENGNRTALTPKSDIAIQIARMTYPKVFKAFHVRGTALGTILNGAPASQGGTAKFTSWPRITSFKALIENQLQPYFETSSSGVARGRIRLDIRIELTSVAAATVGAFHDVTFNSGLRVTDDGLIWLDGLTDDIGGNDNIYTGTFKAWADAENINHASYPKLKKIRINAAIRHDTRISGYSHIVKYDPNKIGPEVDPSVMPQSGNKTDLLQAYVHNPSAFREEHQKNSTPCVAEGFQVTNADGTGLAKLEVPLTKILHQDDAQLEDAAKRKLKAKGRIRKSFRFDSPGIRLDFKAGHYLWKVRRHPDAQEIEVNAPIEKVVLDFENQRSSVMGENFVA